MIWIDRSARCCHLLGLAGLGATVAVGLLDGPDGVTASPAAYGGCALLCTIATSRARRMAWFVGLTALVGTLGAWQFVGQGRAAMALHILSDAIGIAAGAAFSPLATLILLTIIGRWREADRRPTLKAEGVGLALQAADRRREGDGSGGRI